MATCSVIAVVWHMKGAGTKALIERIKIFILLILEPALIHRISQDAIVSTYLSMIVVNLLCYVKGMILKNF